jgi:hypothetical protein
MTIDVVSFFFFWAPLCIYLGAFFCEWNWFFLLFFLLFFDGIYTQTALLLGSFFLVF